ncbi:hypothetical protein TNCV_1294601 [Trichonephila clavipes]|nr:hypothetical protein TNCV_1294601 [Trichonephila clavipes]
MIALSRVVRGSFLIGCCVNVVTSVPVRVPSPCAGSEASRVRTGQWGSPIGSWVFVNFCVHEADSGIGQTQRSVADAVGVARSVVARLWNRFQETENVRRRPGGRSATHHYIN